MDVLPGSSSALLAIDPVALPDVVWYRGDFSTSNKTLSELVTPLRRGQSRLPDLSGNLATGIPIPEAATSIGVWINSETFVDSSVQQSLNLWLRVADTDGSHENLDMGAVEISPGGLQRDSQGGEWSYFEAPLPEEKIWLDPPFNLVAIYLVGRSLYRMPPGSLYVDDITVRLGPPPTGTGWRWSNGTGHRGF